MDFSSVARQALYSRTRDKEALTDLIPVWTNWDYRNWRYIWRSIRHAMIGEVEIKRWGTAYLPQPEGMDQGQYSAYLDRAVFYNMVYRTVTGLTGAIFRRPPRITKVGPKMRQLMKRISKDGLSLLIFSKVTAQEMLSVGRYGVLADKSVTDDPTVQPYLAGYTCENILDWTVQEIDGRFEYDYILLREFTVDRRLYTFDGPGGAPEPNISYGNLFIRYRVLRLQFNDFEQRWEYTQELYQRDHADADLNETPITTMPLVYGVPMKRIPFRFFNATTNGVDVEKPPILDILTLNLSHYKSYAQLEHGRFYTANPVYVVSGAGEESEYHIGPSVVWEIGTSEKAEILEYNGTGLKSLETSLETKETQVASLGGRLIGDATTAGQSDNQVKIKDRNEQSLLLNVTTVLNENFTDLLQILAEWINEANPDTEFRCNQDFLLNQAAAREFRAVTMMYQAGIISIEIIYEYFLAAEVIPEYVSLEQFQKMLDDPTQFPNDPDFEARQEGYADAKSKHASEDTRFVAELQFEGIQAKNENDAEMQDVELQHEAKENAKDRKAAKDQPKIPPVPNQARQALNKEQQGNKGASGSQDDKSAGLSDTGGGGNN